MRDSENSGVLSVRCKRSQCALSPITASQSKPAAPISAAARCRQTRCHYGDLTLLYSFISVLQVLRFYDRRITLTVQGGILWSPLSELIHIILPDECSVTSCEDINETLKGAPLHQTPPCFLGNQASESLESAIFCLLSFIFILCGYPLTLVLTWYSCPDTSFPPPSRGHSGRWLNNA